MMFGGVRARLLRRRLRRRGGALGGGPGVLGGVAAFDRRVLRASERLGGAEHLEVLRERVIPRGLVAGGPVDVAVVAVDVASAASAAAAAAAAVAAAAPAAIRRLRRY